ncbi:hypothetical protein QYE76_068070 [Lolium multiflorum]|uniref:CCHC-type domain-containing protein n=1 Tax=Lolium multiflorum TaxID=4521 RepID=A0AAD8SG24_LOLMU|nr:hypothetical protein QYE76_068070 [Lolium multiflorum]
MAKSSTVSPTVEPNIPRGDKDEDEYEEEDWVVSLRDKGESVFKVLYKDKIASSHFFEILTTAIESQKLIWMHENTIDKKGALEREYANDVASLKNDLEEEQDTVASLEEQLETLEVSQNEIFAKLTKERDHAKAQLKLLKNEKSKVGVGHDKLVKDLDDLDKAHKALESEHSILTKSHEQLQASYLKEHAMLPSLLDMSCDNACATNSTSCEASILKENVELRAQLELLTSNYGKLEENHGKLSSSHEDLLASHDRLKLAHEAIISKATPSAGGTFMSITLGAATKLLDDMMINYSEWHTERAPQGKKVNSVEETSSLSDKIDVIMSMLVNGRSNVDPNNVPLASLVAQEENVDVNFIKNNNFNNNAYRNNSGNNYRPYPSANGNGYGNSYGNSYNNNRNVPSGLEAMLKEFISTQTAFNKSVEEKLDKIDIIASRVDRLASDVNLLKLKVMPNNDIDNKITTTANAIQVRINENIRLMAELRARWDREENEKLAKENNVAKVWTITTISNDNDSHVAAPPTINGKIIGVGNVSTPSAKRTKLPEIAKTAETACDKTAEIFSNLGNNDPIAVAHNDLDFDDCHISEVIKFLQKLAKSPNASAINLAFTKHITNALIKAREEKLKLETSIPRKLEDGWEPIIKMKFNDFECNALCDLGAIISVMPKKIYDMLDLPPLKNCYLDVNLADNVKKKPLGRIDNVHITVNNNLVPVDFVVLDIECNASCPIVLGRPFLRTVGAVIDMREDSTLAQESLVLRRITFRDHQPSTCFLAPPGSINLGFFLRENLPLCSYTCLVTNHVEEIKELKAQVTSLKNDLVKSHEGKCKLDTMLSVQQSPNDKSGLGFKSNNKDKSKNNKNKKGQVQVKDPAKIVCFKCKIEGHHVRSCPLKKKQKGKRPQAQTHIQPQVEELPLPKKSQANAPIVEKSSEKKEKKRTCYICREKGHISSFCTIGTSSNSITIDDVYSLRKDEGGNVFAKFVGAQSGVKKRTIWVAKPIVTNLLGPNLVGDQQSKT